MRPSCGSPIYWLVTGLAMLLSGCASVFDVDGALAVIPYRISSTGRIMVPGNINETGPFDFAIDTGATISVLLEKTANDVGLQPREDAPVMIHGMVGSRLYPTVSIDVLSVGSETWVGAETVVIPGGTRATKGLDGILGVDFLSRYGVGYSARERVIRLYSPSEIAARSYKGWSSVPLNRLETGVGDTNLYAIDITISGRTIPALLDLGASANLMNVRALRFIGERLRKRRKDSDLTGAVEATVVHLELQVRVVETARLRWLNRSFLVADIHVLDVLELDGKPMAIIGSDFFSDRDFVIDFERSRLLVRRSD